MGGGMSFKTFVLWNEFVTYSPIGGGTRTKNKNDKGSEWQQRIECADILLLALCYEALSRTRAS
jgi:hypothetical protein